MAIMTTGFLLEKNIFTHLALIKMKYVKTHLTAVALCSELLGQLLTLSISLTTELKYTALVIFQPVITTTACTDVQGFQNLILFLTADKTHYS